MPVLLDTFPNGLDTVDPDRIRNLRSAYEEWADNQGGLKPDPAIHSAWVRYVLTAALEYDEHFLVNSQAIPTGIKAFFSEHGETLRPDLALIGPKTQKPRLLIQVFPPTQELDKSIHGSRWSASVSTRMMELLHATNIRLGLVTNGEQWMLVDAPVGETTGFISWYAPLWFEEHLTLQAFSTLLGMRRFFGVPDAETIESLLAKSAQDQQEVTDQLGYQVRSAVEILIRSLDKADQDRGRLLLADLKPDVLYEAALTVMMRLVFLMSAEERKLLPLDDPFYAQNYAVSTLRAQLREDADQTGEEVLERRYDAWCRLLATFRVVYGGVNHDRLKLLAYGGSLFDPDRFTFLEGRMAGTKWIETPATPLPVDNRTVLHLLEALQILRVKVPGGGAAEARRLSFRALDIEQIGHVYEGLLDHVAVRADEPTLGLTGSKDKEPEITISKLEAIRVQGNEALVAFLQEETGRTKSALDKALQARLDAWESNRLLAACGNDERLFNRTEPFAGLVRDDDYGGKVVIPAGSLYITQGTTRRATGTHYTPRSLTEPIIQHTLEPLVYTGPAEGQPREKWQLHSPKELLELKICDMAMGSGAFLVQACRYLSERLVESWRETENIWQSEPVGEQIEIWITSEGELTENLVKALPAGDEDRLILAKRLMADRCLYGVDKNPLAVEMAKLSLWLVTLDKNRAFTFLNHALKTGDSLVGADDEMYRRWAFSLKGAQFTLYLTTLEENVATARLKRKELENFMVLDVHDLDHKAKLLEEADKAIIHVKLGCDLLVGVRLLGLKISEQDNLLERLLWNYVADESLENEDAHRALAAAHKENAFHWPLEFPEVFEKGGFSAFVGNPPFISGLRISSRLGDYCYKYIHNTYASTGGTADYCSYFFLRAFELSSLIGKIGFVATNSISQSDSRDVAFNPIITGKATIYYAISSMAWPGTAAVFISIVVISKSNYVGEVQLNNQQVSKISPLLDESHFSNNVQHLIINAGRSFTGSIALGDGFIIGPEQAEELIRQNPKNQDVLFPYINGIDLNSSPTQQPSRWAIYFFDWSMEKAREYPDCFKIIEEKVYPIRKANKDKQRREIWWRFTRPTLELYNAIQDLNRVLVVAFTSKTLAFTFLPRGIIYPNSLVVFAYDSAWAFSILQSCFHETWARKFASTMKEDLRYAPGDLFETYPFPTDKQELDQIGEIYHECRRKIMLARQEGLTATYHRFHNPVEKSDDIAHLRKLQIEMDYAVSDTYSWTDIDLRHSFYETTLGVRFTIHDAARREVLARLLQLNQERYEEEVRQGLHEVKKGKKKENDGSTSVRKRRVKKIDGQDELF
jgi:hypothetical protein